MFSLVVVVGIATEADAAPSFTGLGDLTGGRTESFGVSADGSVVVGIKATAAIGEAFRWTAAGAWWVLGDLPGGGFTSQALGVSGDGAIIVGRGTAASGFEATIGDATHGLRVLDDLLSNDLGLDLTGWSLELATAISDDGRTIVGFGSSPNSSSGSVEGFVAHLPLPDEFVGIGVGGSNSVNGGANTPGGINITLGGSDQGTFIADAPA